MSRRTSTKAVINLFDTTAKLDGNYSANDIFSLCDVSRLDEENIKTSKYATLEGNGFLLDGTYQFMNNQTDHEDIGYWSSQLSNANGVFQTNPKIERTFSSNHSVAGLNLHFDENYSLPEEVLVTFKDANRIVLNSKTFGIDSYEQFLDIKTNDFKYMSIEFLKVQPYNYARLNGIDYGKKMEYSSESDKRITKAKILEELNMTSSEIRINTSSLTVIDQDETFSISNPQGFYTLLQERQKVELFEMIDGVEYRMATHYIKSWDTTSDVISTFTNQDILGLMNGTQFEGKLYVSETVENIVDDIMKSFGWSNYYVDEGIKDIQLSGIIAPCTHRDALQQVAFACCAVVDTSRIGGINIYRLSHTTQTTILSNRKFMSPAHSVKQNDLITDIEVTAHSYIKASEMKDAYKANLKAGTYEISLKEPYDSFVSSNCTIVESSYFKLKIVVENDAEVIIQGYPYVDNEMVYSERMRNMPLGTSRKIKTVKNATLVSADNAQDVAKHLYDYYQYRLAHELKIILEDEKVGNFSAVKNRRDMVAIIFESLDIDLTSGFLATCKGTGYALKINDYDYAGELYANDLLGVI